MKNLTSQTEPEKIMVTICEAASYTGLSYSCIRNLCKTNQIIYVRSGKKYYINLPKLLLFLDETHFD